MRSKEDVSVFNVMKTCSMIYVLALSACVFLLADALQAYLSPCRSSGSSRWMTKISHEIQWCVLLDRQDLLFLLWESKLIYRPSILQL